LVRKFQETNRAAVPFRSVILRQTPYDEADLPSRVLWRRLISDQLIPCPILFYPIDAWSDRFRSISPPLYGSNVLDGISLFMASSLSRCNSMGAIPGLDSSSRRRGLYISPATVKLNHVFEQDRQRQQKQDGVKAQEPATTPQGKGKPRLLLMGQRRYECALFFGLA
jgi:hypothetical protein